MTSVLDAITLDRLLAAAREAQRRAHAPYSNFPVGAALLTAEGRVVAGCNVENASYGLTNCAERVAIGRFVAEGHAAVGPPLVCVVVGPREEPLTPCGACRQVLHEFNPRLVVIAVGTGGAMRSFTMEELLPASFGASAL